MTRCRIPDAEWFSELWRLDLLNDILADLPMVEASPSDPPPRWTEAELREDEGEFRRAGFRVIEGGKA